ncbi:MAG: DUF4093 domain-containing protein [Ruminococcaceae bacterium]|nr:DUF4093 domain-containing protein [Oscillospiraceae bacterium]
MKKRIVFPLPVVVEGKYDKMKLTEVIDGHIITTDGFGIFNKKEKLSLIKRLAERGVVLLCDSDGAGGVIRRHIMSAVPKDKIYNLYIPKIEGKERRKKDPSREGTLGVEGMNADLLYKMFFELSVRLGIDTENGEMGEAVGKKSVTKADFYEDGLTGRDNSAASRDALAAYFSLPSGMTPSALLGAINILVDYDGYKAAVAEVFDK